MLQSWQDISKSVLFLTKLHKNIFRFTLQTCHRCFQVSLFFFILPLMYFISTVGYISKTLYQNISTVKKTQCTLGNFEIIA